MGSWFGAWGMQTVLFSWLVVGELEASAEWVGVCQTSAMLPPLVLLLFGGATADRRDPRRMLAVLHVLAMLPVLALAAAVAGGALRIPLLIGYGLCIGSITAFCMPARDTLLSRVAGGDMMRAVTGMTAVQFGCQALGTLVAGAARLVGSAPMLCLQAGVLLLGAVAASRIPASTAPPGPPLPGSTLASIRDGLAEVAGTPRLRAPVGLVLCVGLLFIGPFTVIFPLLVRDTYGGDVSSLSLVLMMFPIGTIAGSLVMRARGGPARKGRSLLLSLAGGALLLGVIGIGLPFFWMVAATLLWGVCGSVFINSSRTLYQEAAPQEHRARVLAVYQLGFLGAAPLGALAAGFLTGEIGTLFTLRVFAALMLAIVAGTAAFSTTAAMD